MESEMEWMEKLTNDRRTHLGTKVLGLWEDRWYTDIKGNIILVHKSTGFFTHLAHHPWTNRRNVSSVIFVHISRIVTNRSEQFICGVWYQSMGPEELGPRIKVCGEF